MAIESYRELPRSTEFTVGEAPRVTRRFVVTLGDNTLQGVGPDSIQTILTTVFGALPFGTSIGSNVTGLAHPEINGLELISFSVEEGFEGSPYHVLVTGNYGVLDDDLVLPPTTRAPDWLFETQSQDVPALYYYPNAGNAVRQPLTNSAFDYFQGLITKEQLIRAKVTINYAAFPSAQMSSTNSVNSDAYFGGAVHCWLVEGVTSEYVSEFINSTRYDFWKTEISLLYRQTGWDLQLPDVGFNAIQGGQKRRAMVFDPQNAEWIPSPGPVGLNGSGLETLGAPAILVRRVYPEVAYNNLFPLPPP